MKNIELNTRNGQKRSKGEKNPRKPVAKLPKNWPIHEKIVEKKVPEM